MNAVDCSGNASAPEKGYEVTLKPAASNPDDPSVSAKVAAKGSNRARMLQGQATFKDVQLKSDSQGLFQLFVYCKSRAVVSAISITGRTATMALLLYHILHCLLQFPSS